MKELSAERELEGFKAISTSTGLDKPHPDIAIGLRWDVKRKRGAVLHPTTPFTKFWQGTERSTSTFSNLWRRTRF